MSKNLIIAGGGTGGHIYPAVAIARAILKKDPEVKIIFVGSSTGLESKIVPKEGFPLLLLPVGKLNYKGGLGQKILTLLKMPIALFQSVRIILKYKPQAVLGVGGYASGPFVFVASLMQKKTFLWEPNVFPGMTNRWLSRFVDRCLVVFSESGNYLKSKAITQVGLPVRSEIEKNHELTMVYNDPTFKILVFGGSQGARAINQNFSEAFMHGGDWLNNTEIIHQTGPYDFFSISEKYKTKASKQMQVTEFIFDMDKKYQWADLVICRAGASTVAELAACKKPSILIPLPTAADDHQYKNAKNLVDADAAELIIQKDLTPETLAKKISELRSQIEKRKTMSQNIAKFFMPQAALKTAEIILNEGTQ